VDEGIDIRFMERIPEPVTPRMPDTEQMPDGFYPGWDDRQDQFGFSQLVQVPGRNLFPSVIPGVQVCQLHAKERRLNGVEPTVAALHFVDVFSRRTVIPQQAKLASEVCIISGDGTGVTERPEILSGVEAPRCSNAVTANATPA
jgi:hypothetical protein